VDLRANLDAVVKTKYPSLVGNLNH